MRFTRDFLLLLGLFVMVAGIGASSLWWQRLSALHEQSSNIVLVPGSAPEVVEEKTLDRTSIIASLRALLPERQSAAVAVTEVSEEDTSSNGEQETTAESKSREVTWCDATVMDAAFAAAWPTVLEVVVEEGARIVRVPAITPSDTLATATPPQAVVQLSLYPETQGKNCLTHSYIGVTPSGRLIHNNDVILYAEALPDELIGYAFDGHPIMGEDSTLEIDSCGGGVGNGQYAYRIRSDEPFILGCFVGTPAERSLLP